MVGDWRQRRAAKRIKPGTGRALKPLRWWQVPFRALFHLPVPHPEGRRTVYAVDLPLRSDTGSGKARAHLYLDGRHHAESKLPAAFPVEGGTIEVAISAFGSSASPSPSGPRWQAPSGRSACGTACSTTPENNHTGLRTS